jgi:putative transposase
MARRRRHAEEQILKILKEHEAGAKTPELCRRHGISTNTFYRWKSKYGGLELSEMKRLRRLDYNTRRPHSSIGRIPPSEYVRRFNPTENPPSEVV